MHIETKAKTALYYNSGSTTGTLHYVQYERDDARLYFFTLEFIKHYNNANKMRLGVKFSIAIILFHNGSFEVFTRDTRRRRPGQISHMSDTI